MFTERLDREKHAALAFNKMVVLASKDGSNEIVFDAAGTSNDEFRRPAWESIEHRLESVGVLLAFEGIRTLPRIIPTHHCVVVELTYEAASVAMDVREWDGSQEAVDPPHLEGRDVLDYNEMPSTMPLMDARFVRPASDEWAIMDEHRGREHGDHRIPYMDDTKALRP